MRLNSRVAATSRSTPVGSRRRWCDLQSVVYTRVAWATAITKSNLVCFVYNRFITGHFQILFITGHFQILTGHFQILFITGHFHDSVYTRSLLDLFIEGVVFF